MKVANSLKGTLLTALTMLSSIPAFAGGFMVYEIGTPDLGLASAGYAARAQDAATAATNPAGMTRLTGTEFMLGAQALYGDLRFSANAATTVPGNDGGNGVGWFPGGGLYYVYSSSPCLKFGLSAYSNFGLATKYDPGFVGRYHVEKTALLDFTLAPSIAYRWNEMFSVGAALNVVYGLYSLTAAVNNNPLGLFNTPDGELKVKDEVWSFGGMFGMLLEFTDDTRIGVTYNTSTELNFDDKIAFSDTLPAIIPGGSFNTPLDLSMTVPQTVMASFFHQINPCWAILGNIGWQNWSQFSRVDVVVGSANPASFTTNANYKDSWQLAIGWQYLINQKWRLSFGTAYDSDIATDSTPLTVTAPVGDTWRFGFGAQYFQNKHFDLGFGYTLVWAGDLDVDQRGGVLLGRLAGSFDNVSFQYFGMNFHWKC